MSHRGFAKPLSISPRNPIEIEIVENLRWNYARDDDRYGDGLRAAQTKVICHIQCNGGIAGLIDRNGFESPGLVGILEDGQVRIG